MSVPKRFFSDGKSKTVEATKKDDTIGGILLGRAPLGDGRQGKGKPPNLRSRRGRPGDGATRPPSRRERPAVSKVPIRTTRLNPSDLPHHFKNDDFDW